MSQVDHRRAERLAILDAMAGDAAESVDAEHGSGLAAIPEPKGVGQAEALFVKNHCGHSRKVLIARDNFLGYAYHICAEEGFRNDLMTVYLGALATLMLDLWWRASLIGKVYGKEQLDAELAKEGILAFDMGSQYPSIGTFF